MKIGRIAIDGREAWAVLDTLASTARPIAVPFAVWAGQASVGTIDPAHFEGATIGLDEVRLCPPLDGGARIFAAGRNYGEHLTRLGADIPDSPTVFIMPDTAIIGTDMPITYPATTAELDYEVELVAVLAAPLKHGRPASESLLGYTVGNDISARDAMRLAGGRSDLFSQKSCHGATPVGPWIVTLDEIGGAAQPALDLSLTVNGELRQSASTTSMLFSVDRCLDYIDDRVLLRAGDLVFTGSPAGVGLESGRFLEPGDRVEATIERIGTLRNSIGDTTRNLRFEAH